MPPIAQILEDAMAYLPSALDEPFKSHPFADVLVRDGPAVLGEVATDAGYKLQGSPGRGRWSQTPWLAIFDRLVTDSAQRGFYIVYLFPRGGRGVFLSLNQGATAVHQQVGGARYLSVLTDRATVYAGLVRTRGLDGLEVGPIDLGGGGTLTRGYEAANVAARYYAIDDVPGEAELEADLRRFLDLYRALIEAEDHLADDAAPAVEKVEAETEARRYRWHLRAERNPRLASAAKKHHGHVCQVCEFVFGARYGSLGDGYIEAHHLTPFASLEGRPTELNPKTDFSVVCSNCHRMLHRQTPPLTLGELRSELLPAAPPG